MGVYGVAAATSGTNFGLYGRSDSTAGTGLYGVALATSGNAYGVEGKSWSTAGRGVYGWAGATTGINYGVYGQSDSTDGVGVAGFLAALCKEMAVAILVVLPLWHLATCPQIHHPTEASEPPQQGRGPGDGASPRRKGLAFLARWADAGLQSALSVYLAAGLGLASYLILRYVALGYLYLPDLGHALPAGNSLQHALLVGRSLAEYALLTLWPFTTLWPIHS